MTSMKKILLYMALVFALVSCVEESIVIDGGSNQQRVRLLVNTGSGEFSTPTTRVLANENQLNQNLWVLVFNGSDYNATFVEAAQAQQGTGADTGKYFISLSNTNAPRVLVVIANASDLVQAQIAALSGATITQAMNILRYGDPTSLPIAGNITLTAPAQTSMPFVEPSPLAIPMSALLFMASGITQSSAISSDGTSTGDALLLRRITSKVVVDASAVYNQFKLLGVSASLAPRTGSLVPSQIGGIISNVGYLTNYQKDNLTTLVSIATPSDATTNNSVSAPLYLYESTVAQGTAIIVKGEYRGTIGYYRLRFQNPLTAAIDVTRNHLYTFNILSVATAGYPTLNAAMIATDNSTQITAQITVTDLTGHEIVDNGSYYLSVSNSEVIIYNSSTASQSFSNIVTVTTNATATMLGGINTSAISPPIISGGGSMAITNTGVASQLTLSTGAGNIGSTTINISALSADFTQQNSSTGTITLSVGNLLKTIKVTRRPYLNVSGIEKLPGDNFTSGTVVAQGTNNFLSLSYNGNDDTSSTSVVVPGSGGSLYLTAPMYIATSARVGGIAFAMRNNNDGRVKLFVGQTSMDPIKAQIPATTGRWPYIGAFWRAAQQGERLINMPNTTNSPWTAVVVDGTDWIQLASYDGTIPGNDFPAGDTPLVAGGLTQLAGTGSNIQFKIGLSSTLSSTLYDVATQPRYGLVVVAYEGNTRVHPIFIRQGEAPDYLMELGDLDPGNSGAFRTLSKKIGAYNLADYNQFVGDANVSSHTQIPVGGGVITEDRLFTKYPSQAGYMFQWAVPIANPAQQIRAYNPITPLTGYSSQGTTNGNFWYNSITLAGLNPTTGFWGGTGQYDDLNLYNEGCPKGYRRPSDGRIDVGTAVSNTLFAESEIVQSLQYNSTSFDNSVWGYYADGFFDRYALTASADVGALPNVKVSTGATVAYLGTLVFNPNDHHSVFFPASGSRSGVQSGTLADSGKTGTYWTGTRNGSNVRGSGLTFTSAQAAIINTYVDVRNATSVRCVKSN